MGKKKFGSLCGEDHPAHKITAEQVLEMRRLYETTNCRYKDLAEQYGVCIRTVASIMNGSVWKCVTGGIPISQDSRIRRSISRRKKLTKEDVIEIKRSYLEDADVTQKDIAKRFGVSQSRISMIVRGKPWTV